MPAAHGGTRGAEIVHARPGAPTSPVLVLSSPSSGSSKHCCKRHPAIVDEPSRIPWTAPASLSLNSEP
jgi:hypothetical protein